MIDEITTVWTPRGYVRHEDLLIGDTVMSCDPESHTAVLSHVTSYMSDVVDTNFMGVNHKSMRMFVSWDHPLTVVNNRDKSTSRDRMIDSFLDNLSGARRVMYLAPFAPHERSQNKEDVLWSARVAATFAQSRYFEHHVDEVRQIVKDLTMVEARWWLDEFFHWNIKTRAYPNWMFSTYLRNFLVRDMIFHIGPRAGVGVFWQPAYTFRKGGTWVMRTTMLTQAKASVRAGWFQRQYTGVAWNVSTPHGNILVRRQGGTFFLSCKQGV